MKYELTPEQKAAIRDYVANGTSTKAVMESVPAVAGAWDDGPAGEALWAAVGEYLGEIARAVGSVP